MSCVHPPLPHQPFSDLPAQLLAMTPQPASTTPPGLPHRHTAPVPDSPTQSFSALGLGPSGLSPPPPPAPKHEPAELPDVPAVARDHVLPNEFPPTPDLDAPQNKVLFPHAMIKLAPPADDIPSPASSLRQRVIESAPSPRAPLLSLDHLVGDQQLPPSPTDKTSPHDPPAIDVSVKPRAQSQSPQRPKHHRAQTSVPTSSRASPHLHLHHLQHSRVRQHSAISGLPRSSPLSQRPTSAVMTKSYTDETSTPLSSRMLSVPLDSTSPSSPDMGPLRELEAKMSILGPPNVGKTSLAKRYTTRKFNTQSAVTIGQGLFSSKMTYNGVKVKLQIWDTAGQESHRSMTAMYYRRCEAALLAYDITDRTTLPKLQSWLNEVKASNHDNPNLVVFVVGTKLDCEDRRQVHLSEACSAVRRWTSGSPPPPPEEKTADKLSPPVVAKQSLLRSSTTAGKHAYKAAPPRPITPTRSYSHDGLASMHPPVQSATSVTVTLSPPTTSNTSVPPPSRGTVPFPLTTGSSTSSNSRPVSPPPPFRQVGSPTYTSFRDLDRARTPPTSAFSSEVGESFITPASPRRHGVSAGRFSFSGLLGFGAPAESSGAVSSLSRFAEENHVDTSRSSAISAEEEEHLRRPSFNLARQATSDSRTRHQSGSMLHVVHDTNARRKSDDWSSRTGWRMGDSSNMSAAERLSEFGEGVRRKQSGDLLSGSVSGSGPSHLHASSRSSTYSNSRSRAGSLGRDSRLYDSEPAGDGLWGVDVNGIRVGECSALTGEGVDHLFKSVNMLLVDHQEAISRGQTLRRSGSIFLHEDDKTPDVQATGYCCT